MAQRRSRAVAVVEQRTSIECALGDCEVILEDKEMGEHYERNHDMVGGRYECNTCGYQCSFSIDCINEHIQREHHDASAIFNPYAFKGVIRIRGMHTDHCEAEKMKVKVIPPKARRII